MSSHRADAARLIEWTGERCVPWAPDVQVVYEHYHRYLWAQPLVSGRRVLDLGSGEGFGPAILADSAEAVVGIDIDPLVVEHARLNYGTEELKFREGSATDLSEFPDGLFDAVVAFELIEHVAEQDDVLREVARVLAPDGFLILSTPDRRTYSESTAPNPFHEKELTLDELRDLLERYFGNVELLNQRAAVGSTIDSLEERDGSHLRLRIERHDDEWGLAGAPPPFYLIAVASNAALPALPAESTLSDHGMELVRGTTGEDVGRAQARQALAARQRFATKRVEGARALAGAREELAAAHDEVKRLRGELKVLDGRLRDEALRTEGSVAWRLLQAARRTVYGRLGGRTSRGGRLVSLLMRAMGGVAFGRSSAAPSEEGTVVELVAFPDEAHPDVSIVIPTHGAAEMLRKCLRAVAETADVRYEVIVVDDDATAATRSVLSATKGAHIVVNERSLGYLRSVNRGAAIARGRYIVLLNDDTEPQTRWLSELVARAEADPDTGIVTAKLLYPGGGLQEAGGIVWSDGSAQNFGRGDGPDAPEFNYAREVDYGSAAALLVRTDVWKLAGGFDERFAPCYWEDVDLCFTARSHGWRVMYEPKAVVVHHEGASMGTDGDGADCDKGNQRLNASKFTAKWGDELPDQPSRTLSSYLGSGHRRRPAVLVVDDKVPTPDRDAGSSRMMALVEGLVGLDCRVVFMPDGGVASQPYTGRLQGLGVEVLVGSLDVRDRLDQLGSELKLAILSRPYVAPRYLHLVRRHNPGARIVYDTVDLHFVREERRQLQSGSTDMGVPDAFRHLEVANARAADVTFVVTVAERDRLLEACPGISVEVVPMAHDVWDEVPGPSGRAGMLFVGGFDHPPNVDAALHLCREIMPLVHRELNGVKLTLVGPNPPPEVLELASERVEVTGWVEDLRPILETVAVSVAPVRYGGGMNGKITQSLAAGLPVVTSSVGSEGLGAEDGTHMFVADDPALFAQRVVALHLDNDLWRSLSDAGRQIARALTSRERQVEVLRRMLAHD